MSKKMSFAALMAVGVLLFAACGSDEPSGGGSTSGGDVTLTAKDIAFDPTEIDVGAGEEVNVTLDNQDDTEHSFTVDDLDVEIEAEGGESADVSFTAPDSEETIEFHCKYHSDTMVGEIVVGGSTSSKDSKDSTASGGSRY
jgi:plastocyanin